MGKRGPKPKPTALKLVRGETRPSRVNLNEPEAPQVAVLEPPEYLDVDARKVWDRLAPSLQDRGVLTVWDVDTFGAFCTAVVHHARAAKLVNESAPIVGTSGGEVRKNPAMQVVRDQAALIVQIGGRFGLNASDRSAIMVGAAGDQAAVPPTAQTGGVLD